MNTTPETDTARQETAYFAFLVNGIQLAATVMVIAATSLLIHDRYEEHQRAEARANAPRVVDVDTVAPRR